jgi:uncharacterized protein YbjT (DUF2867 family)
MKVIITGSLGNVGQPLAKRLIAYNHAVTVISSNIHKQKSLEAIGAAAAIGSLEDADFVTSVFQGSDAVFVMIPSDFSAKDARAHYKKIGNSYALAIKNAGVKRVVHLSSWGAHLDGGTGFIAGSYDVEQILNGLSDISLKHHRPGSFYKKLYSFNDMIRFTGTIGSNYDGEDKIVMASPVDIATVAAEELTKTHSIKVRYIASDDVTMNEFASILGGAINKPGLKWARLSDQETRTGLIQAGLSSYAADMLVELGNSMHSGALREDYDLHKPAEMGKIKIEDFAKEFVTVYNQQ